MEGENPQKSTIESEFFKIPIEEYEEDMETESAKGKKKEILDLLKNYNKLRSGEEFKEIKDKLHRACRKGDVDLIKIYLSETIKNKTNKLQFKIDSTNRTASLFKVSNDIKEVFVPRTVEHESAEYLITSITGTSEYLRTLNFVEDSAVITIYQDVFPSFSSIKEIYFPTSLKELREGWCFITGHLTKIQISPSNGQFKIVEDKYLIGKSDSNNDEFDTLLFACRDIEEISIPSNIKIISSYAFQFCENLTKVEIPPNSILQTIGEYAFPQLKIKEIYFPASLKELKEGWCCRTDKLTKIQISPSNGQFKIVEDKYLIGKSDQNKDEFDTLLFAFRDIEEISIPSNIKIISSCAFQSCKNLTKVEISSNSNLKIIESCAFSYTNIREIFIPSKVSKICYNAFYLCENLTKVEIPTNSDLQTIGSHAFYSTNIKEIFIPSKVSKICDNAFQNCKNLTKIEIPSNSNLQTIESSAFSYSKIEEIYIPTSLKEFKEGWCYYIKHLNIIQVSPSNGQFKIVEDKYLIGKSDPNKDEFDTLLFACRDIEEISIPSNIKIISSYAFQFCENLTKFAIPPNSSLQTIGEYAFSWSNIKLVFIPFKVSKICKCAFYNCKNLTKVEIPTNSNLQTIERNAFSFSNIKEIIIPSKVIEICGGAFADCKNLTKVEFLTNSNLQTIRSSAFSYSNIKEIFIPSKVSKIYDGAFDNCSNLQIIEISEESKLETFPLLAFDKNSKIIIMIPTSLEKLIH